MEFISFNVLFHAKNHTYDAWKSYVHVSPLQYTMSSDRWLTNGDFVRKCHHNIVPPPQGRHVSYPITFELGKIL